jgi:hypothetical protein
MAFVEIVLSMLFASLFYTGIVYLVFRDINFITSKRDDDTKK